MATFVLVHGAMHGAWCWRDVRGLLRDAGHTVFTPTLTGQGDRRQQLTRDVGVDTHVGDLTELLWFEDLHDVHLVLHSYAGVLAGPVAEQAGERLASITYLAAFLTRPGECLLDVEPPDTVARYRQLVAETGDGWRVPTSTAFLAQWGVTDDLAAFVGPRLTDFPFKCQTDPTQYDPHALGRAAQGLRAAHRPAAPRARPLTPARGRRRLRAPRARVRSRRDARPPRRHRLGAGAGGQRVARPSAPWGDRAPSRRSCCARSPRYRRRCARPGVESTYSSHANVPHSPVSAASRGPSTSVSMCTSSMLLRQLCNFRIDISGPGVTPGFSAARQRSMSSSLIRSAT